MNNCPNEECAKKFEEIEERLHAGDNKFTELRIKLEDLIASQKTLTKALWGLACSIVVALFSFVLGKI